MTRTVSVIWVNRRATSDVRATVQSFLAQAEYFGEISLGFGLGVLAQATSIGLAMLGSCALVICAVCWPSAPAPPNAPVLINREAERAAAGPVCGRDVTRATLRAFSGGPRLLRADRTPG